MRPMSVASRDVAIKWMITSVSEVDWKIDPARSSSSREQRAIDEVAVVRDSDGALRIFDHERLGVFQMALALSGVTVVADGVGAFQALDDVLFEDVGDQAHRRCEISPSPSEETMPEDSWPRCCSA